MYSSCREAIHKARTQCHGSGEKRRECEEKMGIADEKGKVVCDRPTRCFSSGNTDPSFVCLSGEAKVDQMVHGVPLRGGPSRVIRE